MEESETDKVWLLSSVEWDGIFTLSKVDLSENMSIKEVHILSPEIFNNTDFNPISVNVAIVL